MSSDKTLFWSGSIARTAALTGEMIDWMSWQNPEWTFPGKVPQVLGSVKKSSSQSGMESMLVGGIVPRKATMIPFAFFPTKAALIRSAPLLLIREGAVSKLTTSLKGFWGVYTPVDGSIP